ncbi:hypothetical protein KC669_02535 [Candidatus Dojkabacteria bacterium]|uniref:DUF454 family protein n=1 Tax=Candidatus Dojkabacteria bacterium TaxID=2099670 RepID=A0A955RLN3_9BACT|nr:hypothetical protein [Candidatus Dojkabacteria bacterium]
MKIIKQTLRKIVGLALVIIGIIGLILPIMPGWIFLIPGLMMIDERLGKFVRDKFSYLKRF